MNPSISHDPEQHRFSCSVDGHECSVEYEMKNPDTMNIFRTFVHADLRGRGIAEQLMTRASEFAREKGFRVFPSCSYALLFFKRHPEHAAVLAENVDPENGGSCRLPKH